MADPDAATITAAPGAPSSTRSADDAPAPGAQIGRYRIVRLIGRGGMGVVYEARDDGLARNVALKVFASGARARDPAGAARLVREARAAAKLSHPNVVAIYEVDFHDDAPFFAMQLVDGITLEAWLARDHHSWRAIVR